MTRRRRGQDVPVDTGALCGFYGRVCGDILALGGSPPGETPMRRAIYTDALLITAWLAALIRQTNRHGGLHWPSLIDDLHQRVASDTGLRLELPAVPLRGDAGARLVLFALACLRLPEYAQLAPLTYCEPRGETRLDLSRPFVPYIPRKYGEGLASITQTFQIDDLQLYIAALKAAEQSVCAFHRPLTPSVVTPWPLVASSLDRLSIHILLALMAAKEDPDTLQLDKLSAHLDKVRVADMFSLLENEVIDEPVDSGGDTTPYALLERITRLVDATAIQAETRSLTLIYPGGGLALLPTRDWWIEPPSFDRETPVTPFVGPLSVELLVGDCLPREASVSQLVPQYLARVAHTLGSRERFIRFLWSATQALQGGVPNGGILRQKLPTEDQLKPALRLFTLLLGKRFIPGGGPMVRAAHIRGDAMVRSIWAALVEAPETKTDFGARKTHSQTGASPRGDLSVGGPYHDEPDAPLPGVHDLADTEAPPSKAGGDPSREPDLGDNFVKRWDGLLPNLFEEDPLPENVRQILETGAGGEDKPGYVQTIKALPWGSPSPVPRASGPFSIDKLFGMTHVKSQVAEYRSLATIGVKTRSILCIEGPPGVGKTTIARYMAEDMGRPFIPLSAAGDFDSAYWRGTDRAYRGGKPGAIVAGLIQAKSFAPLILIDEIDKVYLRFAGDAYGYFTALLDPEHNTTYNDDYLGFPIDLSQAFFVLTCNDWKAISPILQDRLERLIVPGYTDDERSEIARTLLGPKVLHRFAGDGSVTIEVEPEVYPALVKRYAGPGCRLLERALTKMVRTGLHKAVVNGTHRLILTPTDLPEETPEREAPSLGFRA